MSSSYLYHRFSIAHSVYGCNIGENLKFNEVLTLDADEYFNLHNIYIFSFCTKIKEFDLIKCKVWAYDKKICSQNEVLLYNQTNLLQGQNKLFLFSLDHE